MWVSKKSEWAGCKNLLGALCWRLWNGQKVSFLVKIKRKKFWQNLEDWRRKFALLIQDVDIGQAKSAISLSYFVTLKTISWLSLAPIYLKTSKSMKINGNDYQTHKPPHNFFKMVLKALLTGLNSIKWFKRVLNNYVWNNCRFSSIT